jgi:hypothetical protein
LNINHNRRLCRLALTHPPLRGLTYGPGFPLSWGLFFSFRRCGPLPLDNIKQRTVSFASVRRKAVLMPNQDRLSFCQQRRVGVGRRPACLDEASFWSSAPGSQPSLWRLFPIFARRPASAAARGAAAASSALRPTGQQELSNEPRGRPSVAGILSWRLPSASSRLESPFPVPLLSRH